MYVDDPSFSLGLMGFGPLHSPCLSLSITKSLSMVIATFIQQLTVSTGFGTNTVTSALDGGLILGDLLL